MSDDDNTEFNSGDPFDDAEALCQKYGLVLGDELADILMWINKKSYDANATEEGPCNLRRPLAYELRDELQRFSEASNSLRSADLVSFDGILELACADVYGVDSVPGVLGAVGAVHLLTGRADPLDGSRAMAQLLVHPLAWYWGLYRPTTETAGFADFVDDALRRRWTLPEGVLPKEIAKTARDRSFR